MIKIYLAEDQTMLNSALKMILELEPDFTVVGTATDGEQACTEIKNLQPDVVILDIEMPKQSGLVVAQTIRQQDLPIKIVILTTFARSNYFQTAIKARVNGYLLKDSPSDSLISAIRSIMQGNVVFDPQLVAGVLHEVDNPLSKRELEVLQALEKTATTKELATQLYLSEGTIRNYISAILSKTGTSSRLDAVNLAHQKGWL
ncbi:response regulator [Limosilactobacillus gastricus]|uniref:Response regulatory protein n=1 Tax=Limosilactobacillus gastricus DSM 16045 TaxID=1423749 RepID=A0A0R1VA10_9LACO|nr:response regulator transcription factor [Limosilactobacillus gastricus]KRM02360.1 Response regulatory protein [Limosilactobacillus gastricus DSM 16045]QGF39734.1 response regulator [Limosilactobacillus gastricus]